MANVIKYISIFKDKYWKIIIKRNHFMEKFMQKLLRIIDVAPMLKISQITLRRLIKKRGIPHHRIGNRYFFTEEDISNYLSNVSVPMKDKNDEDS
jgi:excisionase family DNA binding protein